MLTPISSPICLDHIPVAITTYSQSILPNFVWTPTILLSLTNIFSTEVFSNIWAPSILAAFASTPERLQELLRQATAAKLFDVNAESVNKQRIKELYPVINDDDILGGVYMPEDGQADPVGVTNVLAKAAKMEGAQIFEKTPVEKILVKDKKIIGVQTKFGKIECEYVVIAPFCFNPVDKPVFFSNSSIF